MLRSLVTLALLKLAACSASPSDDTGVAFLEITPDVVDVAFRATTRVEIVARDANGDPLTLEGLSYTIDEPDIAAIVQADDEGLTVRGLLPGRTTLAFALDDASASATIDVDVPESAVLSIDVGPAIDVAEQAPLSVLFEVDDVRIDVSGRATWTSSDTEVLAVDGPLATGESEGFASVEATFAGLSDATEVRVGCPYPREATTEPAFGAVLPRVSWPSSVRLVDGAPVPTPYDVKDRFCDEDGPDTIAFVATGGSWCSPCAASISFLGNDVDLLNRLGMDVVIVGVWGTPGLSDPMSTTDTIDFVRARTAESVFIAGGADTLPTSDFLAPGTELVPALAALVVVRTRDMAVIAADTSSLPLADIAANPEWDWSDPDNPIPN